MNGGREEAGGIEWGLNDLTEVPPAHVLSYGKTCGKGSLPDEKNLRKREFIGREDGTFKGGKKRCLKNTINKPDASVGVLNPPHE